MFVLRIFFVTLFVSGVTCKRTSNSLKLLEKELKRKSRCRSSDFKSVMRLREEESLTELLSCLVKALDSSNGDAVLWTLLGEVFQQKDERSKANVCFRESTRLMGKLSKFIKKWHFLGPFTIGKTEVDGDPLEEFGGIKNVSKQRWTKKVFYYSELLKRGELKWNTIEVKNEQDNINVAPSAEWNELILSLQSIGIAEWQGWVVGDFVVNEDGSFLFQCLGASLVYVDEILFTGDLYKRHQFWHPIYLKRGLHTAKIKLRAKGSFNLNFHFKQVQEKSTIEVIPPSFLPDLVQGKIFSKYISLPLNNLHSSNWLKVIKVSLMSQSSDSQFTVSLSGDSERFSIAPGQIKPIVFEIGHKDKTENAVFKEHCKDVTLSLKVSFNGRKDQKVKLNLRCRRLTESFLFTFLDHDGSVQHGAAIPPLKGCESKTCPVLLSLHGTTVPPQNQADSYKRMENGKWVFGVDNLWLLAPTRHGAHNWEGPGMLTSMKALESLAQYTQGASWIEFKADDRKMVIAGHSMGGHGAWQLGTHYPDQTLALISAAGWIRKEDYGDSNLFFRHDVSTSHVDPAVKATMEACVTENDADKHVSNLHGLPVMIRVGAADRTVHPYYSRRMYRLLRQQLSNVTYDEIPKKEHWWWDTYETNDGGVTNDPVIRGFATRHAKTAGKLISNDVCDPKNKNKECSDNDEPAKKYQQQPDDAIDRNSVGEFTLSVYNPASISGVRGVRVLQQLIPFRQSTIVIQLAQGTARLRTVNVARMSLSEPAVSPVNWSQRDITIDNTFIKTEDLNEASKKSPMSFCKTDSYTWEICENEHLESETSRGPFNMGPARRIAESPFLIVTGTTGDATTSSLLSQIAVYISNQFFLTSDTIAHVITDKQLDQSTAVNFNLIVIGGPHDNSWSRGFHNYVPLKIGEKSLILNNCHFDSRRTGALFLAPHSGSRLALILTGNSLEGLQDLVHLATPTILPMARSPFSNLVPDFIVTGPRFGARGPGGYLCSGFWGNSWEYRQDISSCSC